MKINIKYPRLKSINANSVNDLKSELNRLMVVDFEIKRKTNSGSYELISSTIKTTQITNEIFFLLQKNNHYIFPVTIARCKA